ncbi:hypothetical protein NV379_02285 [Paenibacillus sp. N1-5-1-14]|uniref:hypothetical protein n=1 Tax=Paenibacillus radicibacter TaxID=2972488 RepID=UPI002158F012|nr:hypothetical protein [Paenibacillus radicibacter]MCR8641475.1 hypothetical protein [Paenibacillus radicibacter]
MRIEDFDANECIKIIDVSKIVQGDMLWKNGDIVQIKEVDVYENRLDVWRKDKYLSEFIYDYELRAIEKVSASK